jgi:hypothetical protein
MAVECTPVFASIGHAGLRARRRVTYLFPHGDSHGLGHGRVTDTWHLSSLGRALGGRIHLGIRRSLGDWGTGHASRQVGRCLGYHTSPGYGSLGTR